MLNLTLKKTNTFSYVQSSSYHQKSIFKGIYHGETVQMLRNSSSEAKQCYFLIVNFKTEDTQILFHKTLQYLSARGLNIWPPGQHLSLTTYQLFEERKFIQAVKNNWSIFVNHQDTRKKLYLRPIQMNHPSVQQKVTRKKIDYIITEHNTTIYQLPTFSKVLYTAKNIKCRVIGCASCPQIQQSYQWVSYQTHKSYPIDDIYSCDTKSVIYLLKYPVRFKQYIGETEQSVRIRIKHYRNASQANTNMPIYRHLKEHDIKFQSLKLTIIKQINDRMERKQQELTLIKELKTKIPLGLNVIN